VWRREDFIYSHALHWVPNLLAVDLVTVAQEVGRYGVVREGVHDLLGGPGGGEMPDRDVLKVMPEWTNGEGVDVAFEVTGNPKAVRLMTDAVQVWGTINRGQPLGTDAGQSAGQVLARAQHAREPTLYLGGLGGCHSPRHHRRGHTGAAREQEDPAGGPR
jgi:hypothetical protein